MSEAQEVQEAGELVPLDLHVALSNFTQAHRLMMRYFDPGVKVIFQGDVVAEEYAKITDQLYELDPSDAAATLIAEAKQKFAIYAYKRSLILF